MPDEPSYLGDWQFHQATGMVAAQIGTNNMVEAANRLLDEAVVLGKTPHDVALLVIDRQVGFGAA